MKINPKECDFEFLQTAFHRRSLTIEGFFADNNFQSILSNSIWENPNNAKQGVTQKTNNKQ